MKSGRTEYVLKANESHGNTIYLMSDINESADTASVQATIGLKPVGKKETISLSSGWDVITELAMRANAIITPRKYPCFDNPVACSYRNVVPKELLKPISGDAASEQICLLGRNTNGHIQLTVSARFILAYYKNMYLNSDNFCSAGEDPRTAKHEIQVSAFAGCQLYLAEPIVKWANEAYAQDSELCQWYSTDVQRNISKSTDDFAFRTGGSSASAPSLAELRF